MLFPRLKICWNINFLNYLNAKFWFLVLIKGFGHHLAKRLDDHGFRVYAGVLKPNGDGACALKSRKSTYLTVLKLDVTSEDDVKEAVTFVNKTKTGRNNIIFQWQCLFLLLILHVSFTYITEKLIFHTSNSSSNV